MMIHKICLGMAICMITSASLSAQQAVVSHDETPINDTLVVQLQNFDPDKNSITMFVTAHSPKDTSQFGMRDVPFVETNIWNPDCVCRE
jgi:uncharacterized protein YigE (DUF2233 family)